MGPTLGHWRSCKGVESGARRVVRGCPGTERVGERRALVVAGSRGPRNHPLAAPAGSGETGLARARVAGRRLESPPGSLHRRPEPAHDLGKIWHARRGVLWPRQRRASTGPGGPSGSTGVSWSSDRHAGARSARRKRFPRWLSRTACIPVPHGTLVRVGPGPAGPLDGGIALDALTGLEGPQSWSRIVEVENARLLRYRRPSTIIVAEIEGLRRLAERVGEEPVARLLPVVAGAFHQEARGLGLGRPSWLRSLRGISRGDG